MRSDTIGSCAASFPREPDVSWKGEARELGRPNFSTLQGFNMHWSACIVDIPQALKARIPGKFDSSSTSNGRQQLQPIRQLKECTSRVWACGSRSFPPVPDH